MCCYWKPINVRFLSVFYFLVTIFKWASIYSTIKIMLLNDFHVRVEKVWRIFSCTLIGCHADPSVWCRIHSVHLRFVWKWAQTVASPDLCISLLLKSFFPTWKLVCFGLMQCTNMNNCVFESYFRSLSGRFEVVKSLSGPERDGDSATGNSNLDSGSHYVVLSGPSWRRYWKMSGAWRGGQMISHNPVWLCWWMLESTGVLCLCCDWRGTLPHCLLPVHRHVHLVHPSLRDSTRWHQQAHACR